MRDEETHTCPGDGGAEITIVLQIEKFKNVANRSKPSEIEDAFDEQMKGID